MSQINKRYIMTELTLDETTRLNQLLSNNSIRKGTIVSIPKASDIHFIKILNADNPFKIPELMKSTETWKYFTNRDCRVTKVMWMMDLKDGKRLVYYPNPNSVKVLHNSKLQKEDKLSASKILVPDNVVVLWRLDATYIIENEQQVFGGAELRKYV